MSIPEDIERVCLLGWCVYAMSRTSKAGAFKGSADAATCDLDTVARWSRDYPGCGWRVVCGPSGLFGLDVDRPGTHHADGFAAMQKLVDRYGPLPPRPMTRTGGSGGSVLFFKHQGEQLRGKSGCPAPGIDPHRERQAIVIPPSRHPVTGGSYTWIVPPWELSPPPIPGWLATLLAPPPEPVYDQPFTATTERAMAAMMRAVSAVSSAPSGSANHTLNTEAFKLGSWCGAGLLSDQDATSALFSAAQRRRIPFREARDTIRSGLTSGMRNPMRSRHA